MNCHECGGAIEVRKNATYLYTESGLDNVQLVGVEVRHCGKCGDAPVIPDLPGLHRVIARAVASSIHELSDEELAFLATYVAYSDHPAAKVGASLKKTFVGGRLPDEFRLVAAPAIRLATLAIVGGDPTQMAKLTEQFMKATKRARRSTPVTVRRSGQGRKWHADSASP